MTTHKNVKWISLDSGEPSEPDDSQADALAATGRRPAGRIVHDERGSAIWKWAGDTSNSGTSSGILKYINPLDLAVEGQSGSSAESRSSRNAVTDAAGGYDPYNQDGVRNKATASGKKDPIKR
jgi:hypothetical protein